MSLSRVLDLVEESALPSEEDKQLTLTILPSINASGIIMDEDSATKMAAEQ